MQGIPKRLRHILSVLLSVVVILDALYMTAITLTTAGSKGLFATTNSDSNNIVIALTTKQVNPSEVEYKS